MSKKPPIIVIVGPTASGKSDLGVLLAQRFNGAVVSADSRQVYRGLDIGTGKITSNEMGGVSHYGLDIASPRRRFSVAQFQKHATRAISKILREKRIPIIVGGTGFYVDTLVYNLTLPNIKPDYILRRRLEKESPEALLSLLREIDPERASQIDKHNPVRIIRSIEIAKNYGKIQPLTLTSPYEQLWIGLRNPKEVLMQRIDERIRKRINDGMFDEFKKLADVGLTRKRMNELGLEYRLGASWLNNELSVEDFIQELGKEIRKYAKRQMTWFKKNPHIQWFETGDHNKVLQRVQEFLSENARKETGK